MLVPISPCNYIPTVQFKASL